MTNEVKALIEHEDGHKQELNGDTLICFTVSRAGEFLNGKAQFVDAQVAFIGRAIPDPIYPQTIGSLVASIIESSSGGRVRAAFNLHEVARILEEKSKELAGRTSERERGKEAELHEAIEGFMKHIFSR